MTESISLYEYVKHMRRALHAIPELSEEEYKTSEFLFKELVSLGYEPKRIHTGLYADIKGTRASKTVALRCDMDALPINEKTGREFAAKVNMHACGHDGHMAIVLGVARELKAKRPAENVRLIFQYGEEGDGGADKMIKAGVLKGVDEIFAFHLCPELEVGALSSCIGAMFAGTVEFDLAIVGKASHCASREEGADALNTAREFLSRSGELEKMFAGTLLHTGRLVAGAARNIVADRADLYCTFRYFDSSHADAFKDELAKILDAADKKYGTTSKYLIRSVYPPLINSEKAFARLDSAADIRECAPRYTAEDFAFYTKEIDGCMAWLGVRDGEHVSPLHSDSFDFDERALLLGVETMLKLVN